MPLLLETETLHFAPQGASLMAAQMMLVTELCAGGNLSAAIRRGAVTWHKRCALFITFK